MLKIKDNVDLSVLENYGFKHHKRDGEDIITSKWYREFITYNDDTEKGFYAFYPIIEVLENRVMLLRFHCDDAVNDEIVDVIYDLMKKDLVQKV